METPMVLLLLLVLVLVLRMILAVMEVTTRAFTAAARLRQRRTAVSACP